MPLKETPVYRYWVSSEGIPGFDCGILWLAENKTVLMAAACAERTLRPYVCKHSKLDIVFKIRDKTFFLLAIDRCYNNSGGCGNYGTCLNIPFAKSHKCQCRFLYTGDRCEKCNEYLLVIYFFSYDVNI